MNICKICKKTFTPYRNKKQKFCSDKCRKTYHTLYCRDWRNRLSKKDTKNRRKKQLRYYYEHKKEHNERARKNYYKNPKWESKKQCARVFASKNKKEILEFHNNKCDYCNKKFRHNDEILLHHKKYINNFKYVFPFHKECHIEYHKNKQRRNKNGNKR